MRKFLLAVLAAGSVLAAQATAASAQSEAEFVAAFAGDWRIHDETFAQGVQICRLTLHDKVAAGRYELTRETCAGELADVTTWGIADGQLALFAADEVSAKLGGTQRRLTGTTKSGKPIIVDRAGDDAPDPLQAARAASGCYYLGFSDRCATEADLAKPVMEGDTARVNVIVNLNVRGEARDDAGVIGVIPINSCVTTNACLSASDGVWCRAEFGDRAGWLRKLALRQERWPVVSFLNQCGE